MSTAGMRQTLAAAIQRSSTSANYAAAGDPSVGNVYTNTGHGHAPAQAMPSSGGFFNFFSGSPAAAPAAAAPAPLLPMPALPGQHPAGPPHGCVARPSGVAQPTPPLGGDRPAADGADQEKDREIDRLKRDLRKAEEKAEFFRSQVITLQEQVTAMGKPVQPANAPPLADEVARLRAELAEEKAAKHELQVRLQQLERAGAGHGPAGAAPQRANGGGYGMAPPTDTRSTSGSWPPPPRGASASVGQIPSAPSRIPPSVQGHFRGDPLDPSSNPGGPRRAVIVGCDYQGKIGALRAGVADAQQWARFFMKRCDFSEQDIRLLSDDPAHYHQQDGHGERLIATRDNILRALQWLVARSAVGDQCFFVFCGNGAQIVAEEYAGQKLCENSLAPTDVHDDGEQPRVVSDTDVHKALLLLPNGVQATLIYDSCHAGQPLDRSGLNYLTEYVGRGRVDYEKLKGHPVLPRFLELQSWKVRPQPAEAVRESILRCQAVHWAACANPQFCVELPIDERPRGVFTYIFVHALLKAGVRASSDVLLHEMQSLTAQLKGTWRLQQDVQMMLSHSTAPSQPFLR